MIKLQYVTTPSGRVMHIIRPKSGFMGTWGMPYVKTFCGQQIPKFRAWEQGYTKWDHMVPTIFEACKICEKRSSKGDLA